MSGEDFLQSIFAAAGEDLALPWTTIALRLGIAGGLGVSIAALYRFSRPALDRDDRLPPTLVLLAMLIALVTLAVAGNVAVAFTLVGTLAIVRFRTSVSDIRDTTFVIFAVAVGIASGHQDKPQIALIGTAVIGLAIILLSLTGALSGSSRRKTGGQLRLTLIPPSTDPEIYLAVFNRFGVKARIVSTRIDRDRDRLRIMFHCDGIAAEQSPGLLTALREKPEVAEVTLEL